MVGITSSLNVTLASGDEVIDSWAQPARSFLQNFVRDLYAGFSGIDVKRVSSGGQLREALNCNLSKHGSHLVCGGFGFSTDCGFGGVSGVVVGSSDAPFDITGITLASEIKHGTASGQLVRGQTDLVPPTIAPDGNSVSIRLGRLFTNDSASGVVVREVGLCGKARYNQYFGIDTFYYSRDILENPVTVAPGQSLYVDVVVQTEL